MDPNYYYIDCGDGMLYLKPDAPLSTLGLPHNLEMSRPISEVFYSYDNCSRNEEKYIDFLLKLGKNVEHLYAIGNIAIFRVPIELKPYTFIKTVDRGYYGSDIQSYVDIDREMAIIDLTKDTLKNPTPEKLKILSEKIAFYESVQPEEVIIPNIDTAVIMNEDY